MVTKAIRPLPYRAAHFQRFTVAFTVSSSVPVHFAGQRGDN
jgi:hypothetical protein